MIAACLAALLVAAAPAQDERRAASPNGKLEFRIFVAQQESGLSRLAYEVTYAGERILEKSLLGLTIHNQEPLLGENVGLIGSRLGCEAGRYNSLIAEYMQNGSIGRRINVEARVWDNGVAFRYAIPRSTPLEEILIEDEDTEFSFAPDTTDASAIRPGMRTEFPWLVRQSGTGWLGIYQAESATYPRAFLVYSGRAAVATELPEKPGERGVAFAGTTPLVCPWRIVVIGRDGAGLEQSGIARDLGR
ncbi:MAG: glycoside hydrolase family 97 N-terminal domain-containing protein [Bryobacteraceae bacterium]